MMIRTTIRTIIPNHKPRGKAALKLVFATMIQAAERWCRVSTTDLECRQLKLLRAELGLDPPPAATEPQARRKAAAHDQQSRFYRTLRT
jgi:hypothetical protein